MAAQTPFARVSPPGFHANIFFGGLFTVSLDVLGREKGNTRSLPLKELYRFFRALQASRVYARSSTTYLATGLLSQLYI